jgi:trigger factor
MLKSVEDISATKKRLSIEIPSDAIENQIKTSLDLLRRKTKIPGFRPGKAPVALLEKRYGKDVEAEAMEKLIPSFYSEALKEADITPVTQPSIEGGVDFKRNTPLSLTVTVEVRPKIENLSYEGIAVKEMPVTVSDEDVEKTLERLREDRASYEPSAEPVAEGDLVVVDYAAGEGGEPVKDYVFKVGSPAMPEAFSTGLLGAKKSEPVTFEMGFPGDFTAEGLAGKREKITATVKEVKKVDLPALDDEFAKDLDFDDLDALRKHIRERLEESQGKSIANMMKAEIVKKILESHDFEAPPSLVDGELSQLVAGARAQGRQDEPEEQLKEELRSDAERNIRASLLLQMIGEKESVGVTEDELKQKLVSLSGQFGLSPENVMKYYISRDGSLEGLRNSVFEEKVLDLLLERADIEKGEKEAEG